MEILININFNTVDNTVDKVKEVDKMNGIEETGINEVGKEQTSLEEGKRMALAV